MDVRKIHGYLLNERHSEGGAKARFFRRFGFDPTSDDLERALVEHARREAFVGTTLSARGDLKFVFEGRLKAPDGRYPIVRTVWRIDASFTAHLVTAVPLSSAR